jgi:tetratricopeptide (TPR) repeat protein
MKLSVARLRIARTARFVALAFTCACQPPVAASSGQVATQPTPVEQALLDDVAQHPEAARISPLEAALIVGGARTSAELGALSQPLDATLAAIVAALPTRPADPTVRPRLILEALFAPRGGRPLLQTYATDATTLYDVVTTGRFNCVSATMLYILAARRAGIDARPVLLPSHARGLVVLGDRRFVVETTTAHGFDPPAWVSREVLDRARPKGVGPRVDLYADERGTEVDFDALLGIAYGNLGIVAQARGDTALAAALLAREVKLTPPAQAPLVRAQQVSLLTELATRALRAGKFGEALGLARRADDVAPDAKMKQVTDQNIAAIASQELTAEGSGMDDAALAAFPEPLRAYPSAYGDVRALSLTMLGTRRLSRGDVEGSAAALREAAGVATSADVKGQTGHNARLGEINRLGKLSMTDPEAAWAGFTKLGPPDPELATTEAEVGVVIARNRAVKLSNAGRCPELEAALTAKGPPVDRADALRAACHARHGLTISEHGDPKGALDELRAAVRLDPSDPHHRQNLVAVIEQLVDQYVHSARCALTPPLIAEGRALDPSTTFFADATEFCKQQK